jgi:hypothetical protein
MGLWQAHLCAIGRHRRDQDKARIKRGQARSICTGCGRKMVLEAGGWQLEAQDARRSGGGDAEAPAATTLIAAAGRG